MVKKYTPEKAGQVLADGETKIGLPDEYRTYTGKVVGPLGKEGTKGGGKINRGAGAALAGAEIPFPGGQTKKVSDLKDASRQYWFKIKSFKS